MEEKSIKQIQEIMSHLARCETSLDMALTLFDEYRFDGSYFVRECQELIALSKFVLEKQVELIEKST